MRRALDRIALVLAAALIVLLLAWLVFHPEVVAVLQAAMVVLAGVWRVRMVRRSGAPAW